MRRRRAVWLITILIAGAIWLITNTPEFNTPAATPVPAPGISSQPATSADPASRLLLTLAVKGRAPKTDYARTQFGSGWESRGGCDTRNDILQRDLTETVLSDGCTVLSGTLHDPYTGKMIPFTRGADTSSDVQIDHVVALGNAWETGAQLLSAETRKSLANDPLELLAVDGPANQQKSDGDAATWLPSNKAFRCQYVARQIAIKAKYTLWVTVPELQAMQRILASCPNQTVPE